MSRSLVASSSSSMTGKCKRRSSMHGSSFLDDLDDPAMPPKMLESSPLPPTQMIFTVSAWMLFCTSAVVIGATGS